MSGIIRDFANYPIINSPTCPKQHSPSDTSGKVGNDASGGGPTRGVGTEDSKKKVIPKDLVQPLKKSRFLRINYS